MWIEQKSPPEFANSTRSHGGDVRQIAARYGLSPDELIDFSASINSRGLPRKAAERLARDVADAPLLRRYPDPEAHELRSAVSERLGVPKTAVVIADGSAALIAAGIRAFRSRRCLLPIPAFSEYAHACAAAGCAVRTLPLDPGRAFRVDKSEICRNLDTRAYDLVILNNPHNPSGFLLEPGDAMQILQSAVRAGAAVLLDEAFIEYVPSASLTREAARRPGIIALRSITKFYGCPALRVGYAVAQPSTASLLFAQLPAWPVTTLALNAASEAIADENYARDTIKDIECERSRLAAALGALGFYVFPSAANFVLLRLPDGWPFSGRLQERLIKEHHIVVRNCDSFEGLEQGRYLRVAIRTPYDNDRLLDAIRRILGH